MTERPSRDDRPPDAGVRHARFLVLGQGTTPPSDTGPDTASLQPSEIVRVHEHLAEAIARLLAIAGEIGELADHATSDLSRRLPNRRGRIESQLVEHVRNVAAALQDAAGAAMTALREAEEAVLLPARDADDIVEAARRAAQAIRDDAAREVEELRTAAATDRRIAGELLQWVDREFERLTAASEALDSPDGPRRERPWHRSSNEPQKE